MAEESERSTTITKLIDNVAEHLGDVSRWPESDASKDLADAAIKLLRKTFKQDSYPRIFLYLSMVHIASSIYSETTNRHVKIPGLKQAWLKLGDLLD